ncbi:ABC transporter substrate-binding protein [Naasia lichenicola]|uniref:Amino acid ABC transporter substrate-binding protein n=1 Tax=Naasia lichenicola TaxID=2565933 RepID=A0A4V3WSX2_9MICO|nr:ABC transporter substrate-binding protein [Naasia lichenicola]THG29757.1 amino acid ABC transporter substrate-binding protein [Naasia lichenicola]
MRTSSPRRSGRQPLLRALGSGLILLAVASTAACSAPAEADAPMPAPSASPSPPPPTGDGALILGTVLPVTGAFAGQGPAQMAAVELAVRDINAAGGVGGVPVVVYQRDSGDAASSLAETSFDELAARRVDAIIGPSAADLAARLLPRAADAGVPLISPTIVDSDLAASAVAGSDGATDPDGWLFGISAAPSASGSGSQPSPEFAQRLIGSDPSLADLRSGPETYDAAILIALAAMAAGDDGGPSIARALVAVSSEGFGCSSFGECAAALTEGQDIDYVGASGALDLDGDGGVLPSPGPAVGG